MPFFQGSQRLPRNFRALVIFLKGFDFLSCISQRRVHRNYRTLKLAWMLGAILSRLAAIPTGETGVRAGAEAAGRDSRDPQLGVPSASAGFVTPAGPTFSGRHPKADMGWTSDMCSLISPVHVRQRGSGE